MSLFVIGDLHLSFTADKPMDVFGSSWKNHVEKLNKGFEKITDDDVTVICGDISWGMGVENCIEDFRYIDSLPGRKIILKGNHDYWWTTVTKMKKLFRDNDINSVDILHNNSFLYDNISICGTRGWTEGELEPHVLAREIGRLEKSIESAQSNEIFLFLHYPPCPEFEKIISNHGIRHCYYGHIHGESIRFAFNGWKDGCEYRLISADALNYSPLNIH